jgi:hypothetical protein
MSLDYAERRIKEALRIAGGNTTRARQQVIAWTFEDAKLLHALTEHHLTGIVAYHIERVSSGRSMKPKRAAAVATAPKGRKTIPADAFGLELLKAVAGADAALFGLEGPSASSHRGQASAQHVEAIRRMASNSKPVAAKPKKKK